MSTQITTAFVQEYKANIDLLLQQKGSRLRDKVRMEEQASEYDYYDRIGSVEAQEITTRHGDTQYITTPHDRRRVGLRDFQAADLIDRSDRLRLLANPDSAYTLNMVYALGRKIDDVILEAAFGTAETGKTGSGSAAFPSSQQVGVDYVESGATANSDLTIAKLRKAKELLDESENDEDENRFIVVTADQITALLQTTEVTNADYNTVRTLVEGKINSFMGFEFIRTQRVDTDANSYRRVVAYAESGLLLAMGAGDDMGLFASIDVLPGKMFSTQVYAEGHFNAVRMEEEKVVEIKCDETA